MKPYGMSRLEQSDVDCAGIQENGRKAKGRRIIKRRARRDGKIEIKSQLGE